MPDITYEDSDLPVGAAVDAEQLKQEFNAGVYASTPLLRAPFVIAGMRVDPPGSSPRITITVNPTADATDTAELLAVVNGHDATGPTDGLTGGNGDAFSTSGRKQNLFLYSEELTNAIWQDLQSTVVENDAIGPNGEQTADTVTWNAAGVGLRQVITMSSGDLFTISFWARSKAVGGSVVEIDAGDGTFSSPPQDISNIWSRYHIPIPPAGASQHIDIRNLVVGNAIEFWGMQVVDGHHNDHEHAYTKTNGTAVTGVTRGLSVRDSLTVDGREAELIAAGAIPVFEESDFGTESGGIIVLADTLYLMKANVTLANTLDPGGKLVQIVGIGRSSLTSITYTGAGDMCSSFPTGSFLFDGVNINMTGGGTCFNIGADISGDTFTFRQGTVEFTAGGSIGTVNNGGLVSINNCTWRGMTGGITHDNRFLINYSDVLWEPATGFTDVAMVEQLGQAIVNMQASALLFQFNPQSYIFIDPLNAQDLIVQVHAAIVKPFTMLFALGISGAISTIADATVSGSITSVADNGSGIARFTTSAAHGMFGGQSVTNSAFAVETTYNTTGTVVFVSATEFEISGLAFTATDTGSFDSASVTMNSTAHGLTAENVFIDDTVNYDGGTTIYNVLTNSFQIDATFSGSETTGTFDSGSLDEGAANMRAADNIGFKPTFNLGSVVMNDNTTATVISAIDTWTDFNMNAIALEGSNNTFWRLTDTTTGELRYNGVVPFDGTVTASVSAVSVGGSQEFQFRMVVNGSPTSDAVVAAVQLGSDVSGATLRVPITLQPGDLVRPQAQNVDGSSDITIRFLSEEAS